MVVPSCFILISQVNQKTYKSYAFGVSLCKKKRDGNDRNSSVKKYSCLEKSKHLTFLKICSIFFKYCCIYRQIDT